MLNSYRQRPAGATGLPFFLSLRTRERSDLVLNRKMNRE